MRRRYAVHRAVARLCVWRWPTPAGIHPERTDWSHVPTSRAIGIAEGGSLQTAARHRTQVELAQRLSLENQMRRQPATSRVSVCVISDRRQVPDRLHRTADDLYAQR